MTDFLASLARWRGRSFVQEEFESRGFMVPRRFQEHVQTECSTEARPGLDLYWDELAREYVCSAGRTESQARIFPHPQSYRSKYLDELALSRKPFPYGGVPPLHPCLNEYAIKSRPIEFTAGVVRKMEDLKYPEIDRVGIDGGSWTGSKKDAERIFANLMEVRGFKKQKKSFAKACPSGLVVGGFVDTGGRPYCITVPFHLFIAEDLDMVEMFEFSPDCVLPGFWFYYRFDSPESAVLGFHSYVEMVDIMSRSFEG